MYDAVCKKRIDEYNKSHDKAYRKLSSKIDANDLEKPTAKRALNARALDETRDLLPLSTFTSLGIMANLRSWLNILTKEKVRNDPSMYVSELIDPLTELFQKYFPTIFSQGKIDSLKEAETVAFDSKLRLESAFKEQGYYRIQMILMNSDIISDIS